MGSGDLPSVGGDSVTVAGGARELVAGAILGISLAAPPGPVTAVMATAASRGRRREAIHTALGAITGDAIWLSLATLGFIAYLGKHPRAVGLMGLCGAALLFWMAAGAWKSARSGMGESALRGSYRLGLLTVLSSPYSFAWWLANGVVLLAAWGWAGVAGLFASLLAYSLLFTVAFRWLGARVRHTAVAVSYASAAALALFGFYVGRTSLAMLGGG
jgi:threonine/homoserine/homoserine lactone efflux protein